MNIMLIDFLKELTSQKLGSGPASIKPIYLALLGINWHIILNGS